MIRAGFEVCDRCERRSTVELGASLCRVCLAAENAALPVVELRELPACELQVGDVLLSEDYEPVGTVIGLHVVRLVTIPNPYWVKVAIEDSEPTIHRFASDDVVAILRAVRS